MLDRVQGLGYNLGIKFNLHKQMEIRITIFDRIKYWFADFQLGEFVGYEEQRVALKGGVYEN